MNESRRSRDHRDLARAWGQLPTGPLLAALMVITAVAFVGLDANGLDLPAGWVRVPASEGRQVAAFHKDAQARMEAWHTNIGQADTVEFRTALEAQLSRVGFSQASSEEMSVSGSPAELRKYESTIMDKEFLLIVLEVTHSGELWQFTALFRPAETLNFNKQLTDLQKFAAVVLAQQSLR